jgi:hypothetical protein
MEAAVAVILGLTLVGVPWYAWEAPVERLGGAQAGEFDAPKGE